MNNSARVESVVKTIEGDGARVNRLFPIRRQLMNYDPFVLWDHFELTPGAGFPEHPHRGFEAITYLFSGGIEHKDNLGHQSTVYAGGAQRFTAGSGITHSEMPMGESLSKGIQLWINLPRHLKQIDPAYQQIDAQDFTEELVNSVRVKTIVDAEEGIQLNSKVSYHERRFEQDSLHHIDIPFAHRGFIYVVSGEIQVSNVKVKPGKAYFFEQGTRGLDLRGEKNTLVMTASGIPHRQPIYQHGPYVD